jgi:SAM-dependent methyltransferase
MELDEYRRMAAMEDGHWWYRATRQLLAEQLGPWLAPGGRYLDAGGGTGATGSWLAAHGRVVACDIEPLAMRLYADAHPDVAGSAVADIAQLPFATDAFDAALCVTVLYHAAVGSPAAVVGELARVVRPGGAVALLEPGVRRLRRAHDRQTHSDRRFSLRDLRRLLVDNGLEVERSTGAYTFLIPAAAVLAATDPSGRSSDLDRGSGAASRALAVAAQGERAALRHVRSPFGLSVVAVGRVRR